MTWTDQSILAPAADAVSITPHDTNDLAIVSRGIYIGGSGDLKVDMLDGATVTFVGLTAGIVHPIRVTRIYDTGTTAISILAVY